MQSLGVGWPETTILTISTVKLTLPRLSNYAMKTSVKIPKSIAEKFAAITALADAFCQKHLNEEYLQLIHRAVGALARKRPSPLLKGKENVWAAGVVHAVGHVNFLDDPSQSPHCKSKTLMSFLGSP
jgi:Domain of unknown function (DUF6398)